jgi:hypothetical protein
MWRESIFMSWVRVCWRIKNDLKRLFPLRFSIFAVKNLYPLSRRDAMKNKSKENGEEKRQYKKMMSQ